MGEPGQGECQSHRIFSKKHMSRCSMMWSQFCKKVGNVSPISSITPPEVLEYSSIPFSKMQQNTERTAVKTADWGCSSKL